MTQGATFSTLRTTLPDGLLIREFAGSPIRAAFWERASAALRRILEEAEEEALIRAVSAPTDAGALARAISETLPTDSASNKLDPLALQRMEKVLPELDRFVISSNAVRDSLNFQNHTWA